MSSRLLTTGIDGGSSGEAGATCILLVVTAICKQPSDGEVVFTSLSEGVHQQVSRAPAVASDCACDGRHFLTTFLLSFCGVPISLDSLKTDHVLLSLRPIPS